MGKRSKIISGVLQGSPLLGPLFFILYINSICNLNIDSKIVTYAVNTCLIFTGNSWISVQYKTITELKRIANRFKTRKLSLKIKKKLILWLLVYYMIILFI